MSRRSIGMTSAIALLASLSLSPAWATNTPDDEDTNVEAIIVTGSRIGVRQGGAQDIGHFRGEAERKQIPFPDSITPEGLMGTYDLTIGAAGSCDQLFCLTSETMRASLTGKPDDKLFVGLGFNTDIQADDWSRAPLNLVAVVDKSGSMTGRIELVKASLRQVVGQLRPGDQISIVLYGSTAHLHMAPTPYSATSKDDILKAIDAIAIDGATYMEAGLKVGYETAFASQDGFKGSTRLMLFTDEQPNVGRTDAESFIGMAKAASLRNVGLTTIGVGTQFDAALATKVSSTRGGNLYFMADEAEMKSVFEAKLDTMVSELAHDLRIELKPHPGYRVSAVYGVPGEVMTALPEGAVAIDVPTAFLSTEGGGVFFTLARTAEGAFLPEPALEPGAVLADVKLSYVAARDGAPGTDSLSVAIPAAEGKAGDGLRLAHVLVDEYLALKQGTTQFHAGDEEAAYQTFRGLAARLDAEPNAKLKPERELAGQLLAQTAFLSGNSDEAPPGVRAQALVGAWEVVRINGDVDLVRGDRIVLNDGDWAEIVRKRPRPDDEGESYLVNDRQLLLSDSKITFNYRVRQDSLVLTENGSGIRLALRRVTTAQAD